MLTLDEYALTLVPKRQTRLCEHWEWELLMVSIPLPFLVRIGKVYRCVAHLHKQAVDSSAYNPCCILSVALPNVHARDVYLSCGETSCAQFRA